MSECEQKKFVLESIKYSSFSESQIPHLYVVEIGFDGLEISSRPTKTTNNFLSGLVHHQL